MSNAEDKPRHRTPEEIKAFQEERARIEAEHQEKLNASFFRLFFYARMLAVEAKYATALKMPQHVLDIFMKVLNACQWAAEAINGRSPKNKESIAQVMRESEEKTAAIANINERLFLLDEETVLRLEKDFTALINVNYSTPQPTATAP